MAKLKTLAEKQEIRYKMVYAAFAVIIAIPVAAIILAGFGIDISSTTSVIGTTSATLSAIVIAHMATSPKDDNASS